MYRESHRERTTGVGRGCAPARLPHHQICPPNIPCLVASRAAASVPAGLMSLGNACDTVRRRTTLTSVSSPCRSGQQESKRMCVVRGHKTQAWNRWTMHGLVSKKVIPSCACPMHSELGGVELFPSGAGTFSKYSIIIDVIRVFEIPLLDSHYLQGCVNCASAQRVLESKDSSWLHTFVGLLNLSCKSQGVWRSISKICYHGSRQSLISSRCAGIDPHAAFCRRQARLATVCSHRRRADHTFHFQGFLPSKKLCHLSTVASRIYCRNGGDRLSAVRRFVDSNSHLSHRPWYVRLV